MVDPAVAARGRFEAVYESYVKDANYFKKYSSLQRKCDEIQQANEKLVNRLQHIKFILKKYKRERRHLKACLDRHGDKYQDVTIPAMWEIDGQSRGNKARRKSRVKGQGKSRRGRAQIDPNAPKKPINAYIMFCQEHRSEVQQEYLMANNSDIDRQELTKHLALKWNNLSTEEKKIYYSMYEEDKVRYAKEVEVYEGPMRNTKKAITKI